MKTKSFGLAGWIDILSNNDRRHVNTLPAKRGFTLAEVLITLGIIGTVAAMTLPALNTKIRQKIYSARLKTFYSTMRQGILLFLACAQNNLSHCGGQGFCTYGINSKNMHAQRDTYLQMCRTSPQTCSTLLKYDNWEFRNDYPY